MSRYLSWVCGCCYFFSSSYAPLQSDEHHHDHDNFDSSRHAASVELADGGVDLELGHTTDDDHPIYTVDEDAQLVLIAPLPPRPARTAPPPEGSSAHSAAAAATAGRPPKHVDSEPPRRSLPPLTIDSASASRSNSVRSSPARSPSQSHRPVAAHSKLSTPTSKSAAAAATASDVDAPANDTATATRSSPRSSQSSLPIVASHTLPSPTSSSRSSSSSSSTSSSSSPSRARPLSARPLSNTAALTVKQFNYSSAVLLAAVQQNSNSQADSASANVAASPPASTANELTVDELDAGDELSTPQQTHSSTPNGEQHDGAEGADTEALKQQPQQPQQRRMSERVEEEKEAEGEDAEALLAKGVASPVIQIPSPRHRQQSIVQASSALTDDSYLRSTDSSLSTMSISPSVAPTSPGESSAPASPSSASLSSSFSSVSSGVSLISSLASTTSPRSSPFVSSTLSSSHPTPLQLHIDSHVPASSSSFSSTLPENKEEDQSHHANGVEKPEPALSPQHKSSHRRLSSAATPTTTATIAPPHSSVRTNPPSPAKDTKLSRPVTPSIPVALPTAPAAPAVRFKKGENPLLTLNIPKGQLSVEHISSIIALFSPPTASSTPVSALLSTLASHLTYIHLFNFLISAPRTVSAAVFKHFSQPILARHKPPNPRPSPNAQIGLLLLQFLTDHLQSITTSASALTFTFTFPRAADSFTLDVPTPDMFVLESRHPSDATLVHPLNSVRKAEAEVRRIVFARVVRVMIGKDSGIVGLGSGDLSVRKVFSFSCDMRYERRVGEVDVDGSGRSVVEDMDGKVRVENGHYVLARYDDWLVVTVLGQQVQIGLPNFARVNE